MPPILKCVNVHASGELPVKKREVSTEKGMSAPRHSPMPDVALTLRNLMSVLLVWTPLPKSAKDGPKVSPSASPTQHASHTTLVEGKLGEVLNIPPLHALTTRELSVSPPQHDMGLGAAAPARIPAISLPKWLPLTFIVRKT